MDLRGPRCRGMTLDRRMQWWDADGTSMSPMFRASNTHSRDWHGIKWKQTVVNKPDAMGCMSRTHQTSWDLLMLCLYICPTQHSIAHTAHRSVAPRPSLDVCAPEHDLILREGPLVCRMLGDGGGQVAARRILHHDVEAAVLGEQVGACKGGIAWVSVHSACFMGRPAPAIVLVKPNVQSRRWHRKSRQRASNCGECPWTSAYRALLMRRKCTKSSSKAPTVWYAMPAIEVHSPLDHVRCMFSKARQARWKCRCGQHLTRRYQRLSSA